MNKITLRTLITKALSGEVQIPEYQREFVTNADNQIGIVNTLLDDLHIGEILVHLNNRRMKFSYSPLTHSAGHNTIPTELILDGQQRTQSILNIFHTYNIGYNTNHDDRIFIPGVPKSKEQEATVTFNKPVTYNKVKVQGNQVPMWLMLPTTSEQDIIEWTEDIYDDDIEKAEAEGRNHLKTELVSKKDALYTWIISTKEDFLSKTITYESLNYTKPRQVIKQFNIVNTKGRPLTISEVVHAIVNGATGKNFRGIIKEHQKNMQSILNVTPSKLQDLLIKLFQFQQDLKFKDFGGDTDWDKALSDENLTYLQGKVFKDARKILRECGVLTSYRYADNALLFVLLGVIERDKLKSVSHKNIAEGFIRQTVKLMALDDFGYYRKSSANEPSKTHKRIKEVFNMFNTSATEEEIKKAWHTRMKDRVDILQINSSSKFDTMATTSTVLFGNDASNLMKPFLPVTDEGAQSVEYHHIVPKNYLKECAVDASHFANCLVIFKNENGSILDKAPSQYIEDSAESRKALAKQCIDIDLLLKLTPNLPLKERELNFNAFISNRAESLIKRNNELRHKHRFQ